MSKRTDYLTDQIASLSRRITNEENQNQVDWAYKARLRDEKHFLQEWLAELEAGAVRVSSAGESEIFRGTVDHA